MLCWVTHSHRHGVSVYHLNVPEIFIMRLDEDFIATKLGLDFEPDREEVISWGIVKTEKVSW